MLKTIPAMLNKEMSFGIYPNLEIWHDTETQAVWFSMAVEPRPCFTWGLIRDIMQFQQSVQTQYDPDSMRYLVFTSSSKDVFSFGGDLKLFQDLIANQNVEQLTQYANDCVTILYDHYRSLGLPLTSISLIEGDALGAGFESALSSNVLIAERGVKMGFPEILFNLVPGQGAYNLISRRVGGQMAKEIILGGKLYTSEELHKLGLVDILVDAGGGREAVDAYIRKQNKSWNAHLALQRIQGTCQRMTREELQQSSEIWVEAALKVRPAHLRVMDRLVRAQNRSITSQETAPVIHQEPAMMALAQA